MNYPQLLRRPSDKSYCIPSHSWTQVSPFYIIINVSVYSEYICLVFILLESMPSWIIKQLTQKDSDLPLSQDRWWQRVCLSFFAAQMPPSSQHSEQGPHMHICQITDWWAEECTESNSYTYSMFSIEETRLSEKNSACNFKWSMKYCYDIIF